MKRRRAVGTPLLTQQDADTMAGSARLDADTKRELGDVGWWFDTAALAPNQTADHIIRDARRRALVN